MKGSVQDSSVKMQSRGREAFTFKTLVFSYRHQTRDCPAGR